MYVLWKKMWRHCKLRLSLLKICLLGILIYIGCISSLYRFSFFSCKVRNKSTENRVLVFPVGSFDVYALRHWAWPGLWYPHMSSINFCVNYSDRRYLEIAVNLFPIKVEARILVLAYYLFWCLILFQYVLFHSLLFVNSVDDSLL